MTSTKTTTTVFRLVLCFVLGLALSAFGVFHSINTYPGPEVFARFTDALPVLGAVASFALGVATALVGLAFLLPALLRLPRHRQMPQPPPLPVSRNSYAEQRKTVSRPVPVRRDFDPEVDGFGGEDFRGGTGSGYGGAYGGNVGPQRDNGEQDERPWAGNYR